MTKLLVLHDNPANVYQTDFTAGSGNALQACVASIFHLHINDVPNFITMSDYTEAIRNFINPFYKLQKINLPIIISSSENITSDNNNNSQQICILRGKSPRGDFGHVIVAKFIQQNQQFEYIWDPHPDSTFLDENEPYGWYMIFESL